MADVSLRQRALAALARREYSRPELARKLAGYSEDRDALEALLDGLEREGLLSTERFAESLVHRRGARYGSARIALELKEHGVDAALIAEQMAELAHSERERCRSVWAKKFTALPKTFEERARQARFLTGRGFSSACVADLLDGRDELASGDA